MIHIATIRFKTIKINPDTKFVIFADRLVNDQSPQSTFSNTHPLSYREEWVKKHTVFHQKRFNSVSAFELAELSNIFDWDQLKAEDYSFTVERILHYQNKRFNYSFEVYVSGDFMKTFIVDI